jgi:phosphoglycerate dehydrogenase-like enzyme
VGHDGIDKAQATAAGLLVTNTPGVLEDAVAEHALALLLAVTRNLAAFVRSMDAGNWSPRQGLEVRGRTLAVIGCGAIGRRVARAASLGFGMRVVGMEPRLGIAEELRREWGLAQVTGSFAEAVRDADAVSLHLPANAETRHLIGAGTIALMRPGAILINTARGAVVDEVALYEALAAGRLAAAGLDVFETEPYVPRHPDKDLRTLPNVVLTPHVSSSTREACARVATACLANLRSARDGRYGALNLLNPEVLGRSDRQAEERR